MDQSIRLRRPEELIADELDRQAIHSYGSTAKMNRSAGPHQIRDALPVDGNGSHASFTLSDGTLP